VSSQVPVDRVRSALDQLADAFARQEQTVPNSNERGWGQFLDLPRSHVQIGSYGTASALLALALADRTNLISGENSACLSVKWESSTASSRRSSQTLRMAFAHLTLRVIRTKNGGSLPNALENVYAGLRMELLARCINQNAWGDWWISNNVHDRTPSVFTTSIVVLSFAIFEHELRAIPEAVNLAVRDLEERLRGGHLSLQQSAAAFAAIASLHRTSIGLRLRGELRGLCGRWAEDATNPLIHFYDFQYVDQSKITRFERDYFIMPRGVLIGIAAIYVSAVDWRLRLEAHRIINIFLANLSQNNGVYKAQSDQYTATKDQAWVAILLTLGLEAPGVIRLGHRLLARAIGPKPETWFWNVILPVTIVVALGGIAVALGPGGHWAAALGLPEFVAEGSSLLVAAIGGAVLHHSAGRIGRKLLPGY
jgi:hypothetical protein